MSIILNQIKEKIEEIVNKEEVELVEYRTFNLRGKLTIRCLVDYPQGGITLDKCGRLNKIIFNQLQELLSDVNYTVEVNSPGLDRPLRQIEDFLKVEGKVVLLWLKEPVFEKSFIEATLKKVESDKLFVDKKGEQLEIDFNKVKLGKQKFRT
jgi:ribosome maturation factor RimP